MRYDSLCTETWTIQTTTGEKPPPLACHTLTMTDGHRATVFGGFDGVRSHNDTYVLDVKTWVRIIIAMITCGPHNMHVFDVNRPGTM